MAQWWQVCTGVTLLTAKPAALHVVCEPAQLRLRRSKQEPAQLAPAPHLNNNIPPYFTC